MKKILIMLALVLGVSVIAEDTTTGAIATMKKGAKTVMRYNSALLAL